MLFCLSVFYTYNAYFVFREYLLSSCSDFHSCKMQELFAGITVYKLLREFLLSLLLMLGCFIFELIEKSLYNFF